LLEEERQKIKNMLFILEKINVSESAYRELTVFCDGLPRKYLVSQCQEDIDDNVKSSLITEKYNTTKFEILLTFDLSPEIFIFILSVSGDMKFLQLVLGLGGCLCNYSCPWYRVHKNHKREDNRELLYTYHVIKQCTEKETTSLSIFLLTIKLDYLHEQDMYTLYKIIYAKMCI
jgi:hypothetical protein